MTLLHKLSNSITSAVRACPHPNAIFDEDVGRLFYKGVHDRVFKEFSQSILDTKPLFGFGAGSSATTTTDAHVVETEGISRPSVGTARQSPDLMRILDAHRTKELPSFAAYSALPALIHAFQAPWPAAVHACLEGTADLLEELLRSCVDAHFSRFPKGLAAVW